MSIEQDAQEVVDAQRERGFQAGQHWARSVLGMKTRAQIIDESDRRYPVEHPDFILMHNLSGGFIEGAEAVFAERI